MRDDRDFTFSADYPVGADDPRLVAIQRKFERIVLHRTRFIRMALSIGTVLLGVAMVAAFWVFGGHR